MKKNSIFEKDSQKKSKGTKAEISHEEVIRRIEARQRESGAVLRLTIGLDLGDRASCYCVLDEKGEVLGRGVVVTERKELEALFGKLPASEVALEVDALAVGESTIGNARTQSDRGQCAAGEADQ